jgi:hypothetical protein
LAGYAPLTLSVIVTTAKHESIDWFLLIASKKYPLASENACVPLFAHQGFLCVSVTSVRIASLDYLLPN